MGVTKVRCVCEALLLLVLAIVCGASGGWAWIVLALGCISVGLVWWSRLKRKGE